jgi:opacity protein-like surface antigen
MKNLATGLSVVLGALAVGPSATAQENTWRYGASIYLFGAETRTSTDTPFGKVDAELSFSDVLDNLDVAFMGTFEASNGLWSFIGDYMYTDIGFSESSPGPVLSRAEASVETQIFSGYATYRVHETPTARIDLGAGIRWYSTDTEITLTGGAGNGLTFGPDDSVFYGLIAARAGVDFSERWSGTAFVDYGGFDSDEETWQVLLTMSYAINDAWSLRGGYRYISVENVNDGNSYTFEQSGPIFGATYRF